MRLDRSSWQDPRTRRRLVVAAILVAGWTLAAALYVTTPPVVEDPEIYEMEHSKKALRDLERIGGKAAVFTSELNAWVASRWEGKARAYTVAWLTVLVAGGYALLQRAGSGGSRDARGRAG
ncbi:hypothetical protein [Anaeromyxobacter diazotrophicus]|uniref:Transmembrane protein n=1 Tax=Anaeromyxobacter diazotrophicus TaxID=2590199 RepID=A0A7I9VSH0_9BACT|nr:hypothetical protein [Anaeromyxobacter diazotrophicus]GEJ59029.1 hypothetical protein AMYX_37700 [Anaeromyxobacter diazotrophicus]